MKWSVDFVTDCLADGRRFRALTVVDNFSREAVLIKADFSLTGKKVARALERLSEQRAMVYERRFEGKNIVMSFREDLGSSGGLCILPALNLAYPIRSIPTKTRDLRMGDDALRFSDSSTCDEGLERRMRSVLCVE